MQALDDGDAFETSSEASLDDEPIASGGTTVTPAQFAFIHDRSKRRATFKKRKGGLMKRAYELSALTGTQVLVLAVSENGLVYTFTTSRLQALVTQPEGKNLIQSCLGKHPGALPTPSSATGNTSPQGSNSQASSAGQGVTSSSLGSKFGVDMAEDETTSELKYIRNERFWLADGNIILATKLNEASNESPRYVLFRVHKSVLARQSEVFEHMLGAAASASPDAEDAVNEMYDGLPIVEMPDSKEHVAALLEVLYGGILLPFKHFDPRSGDTNQLVLEIAAKYEMTSICQRVIAHIEDYWPTSLAAWDIFESRLQMIREDDRRDDEMDCYAQEPANAIVLARRHDNRYILPAAFYDLSRIPASCDLTARQGRAEDAPDDEVDNDTWNVRAACWSALSVADYHRVCVARERLRAKAVHAASRALHARPAKGCYSVTRCRDQSVKAQAEARERCYATYDVLRVLKDAAEKIAVCPPCREEIGKELQSCREGIWRELPGIFSL